MLTVRYCVAPHTGAWIETQKIGKGILGGVSHPTRVRGLKLEAVAPWLLAAVAPHTGAWIETEHTPFESFSALVAPHTGAWIETGSMACNSKKACRTPHGCVD